MMRKVVVALAALSLCSASATEPAKPAAPVINRFHFDTTYEQGRLLKLKTPRGVTRYEYDPTGKLTRKVLPHGITVDYYRDRDGKLVETRFSNGLARTRYYDRQGKLSRIIGSDGFVLTVSGAGAGRSVVVTGPKDYRFDMTPVIQKSRTSYASMMGKLKPKAMLIAGGGGGGCSAAWWADVNCDWNDGGDFGGGDGGGGGGGYDDGWGSGTDEWGGDYSGDSSADTGEGSAVDDGVATDWGGENGVGEYGDDPGRPSGRWGEIAGDPLLPSPGDYNYMRCMQTNCENQNVDFRRVCSREPVQNQEMCYRYTAKFYFKCERECWYASY